MKNSVNIICFLFLGSRVVRKYRQYSLQERTHIKGGFFFLRTENLATQTDRDAGPRKRLLQSKARKRKGTAKPQWAGAMRGRKSQRLPRRAAPAAGSRRVRHLVAERVRGSGRARPSECPRSSPRSLHVHVHVHVRSRGRANVRPKRAHLREENAPQWRCFPVRASRHPAMDLRSIVAHRCARNSARSVPSSMLRRISRMSATCHTGKPVSASVCCHATAPGARSRRCETNARHDLHGGLRATSLRVVCSVWCARVGDKKIIYYAGCARIGDSVALSSWRAAVVSVCRRHRAIVLLGTPCGYC